MILIYFQWRALKISTVSLKTTFARGSRLTARTMLTGGDRKGQPPRQGQGRPSTTRLEVSYQSVLTRSREIKAEKRHTRNLANPQPIHTKQNCIAQVPIFSGI